MKKTIGWESRNHQIEILFFCFLIFCAGSGLKKMVFKLKSAAPEKVYQVHIQSQSADSQRASAASYKSYTSPQAPSLQQKIRKTQEPIKSGIRFHKVNDYLKYQVGLDDQQIEIVRKRDREFNKDIRMANSLQLKKQIMEKHYIWMTVFLGPEHYQEYQNIKSEQTANRMSPRL